MAYRPRRKGRTVVIPGTWDQPPYWCPDDGTDYGASVADDDDAPPARTEDIDTGSGDGTWHPPFP